MLCILLFSFHAWLAVELEENSSKVLENEYPFLNPKYSPAHLFIDTNDGNGQVIPSQSLFDIEINHSFGLKQ